MLKHVIIILIFSLELWLPPMQRNCNVNGCPAYSHGHAVQAAGNKPKVTPTRTATPMPSVTPTLTPTPTMTPTPTATQSPTPNAAPGTWYDLPAGPIYVAHTYTDGDRALIILMAGSFIVSLLSLMINILERRK